MRLMLDLKGEWDAAFYQRLLRLMSDNKVLDPIYSLGGPRVRPYFDGGVMTSVNRVTLASCDASGRASA